MLSIYEIETIYDEEFGKHMIALFGAAWDKLEDVNSKKMSLSNGKEVFFETLLWLLQEGKVVFFLPNDDFPSRKYISQVDGKTFEDILWDDTPENIVKYIRDNFPKHITDENDDNLNLYWYTDCPEIAWVDEKTGALYCS